MSAAGAPALVASPFRPEALPLCAHCGLPVVRGRAERFVYCCSGCALAHRLTGGAAGHGQAAGMLMSVGIGAFLAMNVMMLSFVLYSGRGEADRAVGEAWVRWALLALATPAMVLLGGPFLTRGFRRVREWRLDTDALIVLGVAAAYALSLRSVLTGEGPLYLDTAMGILLFVTIGRYLEAASRARTTDALAELIGRLPDVVARVRDGREERVAIAELRPGDRVRVRPGERIPVDGIVLEGEGSVSEAEITGESLPVRRAAGSAVSACALSLDGSLLIEARRTGADTTVARIVRIVERARAGRHPLGSLVDRLAAAFVPVVLSLALATFAYWSFVSGLGDGVMNALSVLLIACPCALGIAAPLASTAAAGRAAAAGVLVRSGEVFERLAATRRAFLDKTGTLTRGDLDLVGLQPAPGLDGDRLLALAAALEAHSEHPVAAAIVRAASDRGLRLPAVTGFRALPGRGVLGAIEGLGPARLGAADFAGPAPEVEGLGATVVHLSAGGAWQGALVLRDTTRPSARDALAGLHDLGIAVEVLSGDRRSAVEALVAELPGLAAVGELTPEAKLARIERAVGLGETPAMVGDGINDAPALARAAVGITLESGTDLAREVADITILGGDLRRLPWIVGLARRTLATIRRNLFWAFFYNAIGIALAIAGRLHPLFGALAMIVSSLSVVLYSQRLTRHPLPGGAT